MASLIKLSKVPEVLFIILKYLKHRELFKLLLTCKALYPACYLQLWSSMDVCGVHAARLIKLIEERGADTLGFTHTKFFRLPLSDWCKPLAGLLTSGSLNPRTVELEMQAGDMNSTNHYSLEETANLSELMKYSKTKSSKDLSIHLKAEIVRDIPQILDLDKITRYQLHIWYHEPGYGRKSWSTDDYSTAAHIKELTELLSQLVNLKYFSWKTQIYKYNQFEISDDGEESRELQKLQTAFTNMQHLKTLILKSFLFHPSFFLTPPKSTKILKLEGEQSPSWWRKFAACPFIGVENLSVKSPQYSYFQETQMKYFVRTEEARQNINELMLKDVAITSLSCFSADEHKEHERPHVRALPVDLEECIFQKNGRLGKGFRRRAAYNHAAMLLGSSTQRITRSLDDFGEVFRILSFSGKIVEEDASAGNVYKVTKDIIQALPGGREAFLQILEVRIGSRNTQEWSARRGVTRELVYKCTSNIQDKRRASRDSIREECTDRLFRYERLTVEAVLDMWLERIATDIDEEAETEEGS
ncbi:hypothetical protein TWF281_010545 [Arthrobotrys megalospora]